MYSLTEKFKKNNNNPYKLAWRRCLKTDVGAHFAASPFHSYVLSPIQYGEQTSTHCTQWFIYTDPSLDLN